MVKSSYLNFRKDGKICEKTNKKQNNIEIWLREVQWRSYMYEDIENKILIFSQRTAKPFKGICISIGAIILCLVEWHGFWTPCLDIIVIKEGLQSLCWFFYASAKLFVVMIMKGVIRICMKGRELHLLHFPDLATYPKLKI